MTQATNQWGIELNGEKQDIEVWREFLKPPFDPYVEEVKDERGDYLALRSCAFDGLPDHGAVHQAAKDLFKTLNVAMGKNVDADPVTNGAVVEFVPNAQARRHHHMEAEGIVMRIRMGMVRVTVTDAAGNVVEPPAISSKPQEWMRAAMLNPNIESALRYSAGQPGWVDLYKAYEALDGLADGLIPKSEKSRFRQTANVGERHHPKPSDQAHAKPMELWEGRAMITQWIAAAVEELNAKNP